jgi:hypothetical protein
VLLCLDHVFATPPRIHGATIHETITLLEMLYAYTRLLHDIANLVDPCDDQSVQKLFTFQSAREDMFWVLPSGRLYCEVVEQQMPFFEQEQKDGISAKWLVSRGDLSYVLRNYLVERLRFRVLEESEICRRAKVFSPCLNHRLAACTREECRLDHVDPGMLNPAWYNHCVRIHLQQILIFQNLHFVNLGLERGKQQMYVDQH